MAQSDQVAEASAKYLVDFQERQKAEQACPPGYKQTEVGEIPEDWECKRLGELGDVVRGGSPRPAGDPKYFNGNYIPWLTVASLTSIPSSVQRVSTTSSMLTELGAKQSRTLEAGTLIISNSGATLGVAKILDIRCCANDGVAAIINQRLGNKSFLVHYINTKTKELHDKVATGNGQPNLNTDLIKVILVPFPSELEQAAIASALSEVDALIESLEKLIAKKQAIKTATMQQLLTGKTRLPQFAKHPDGTPKGTKPSEVGEIPEDWKVVSLASIGSFSKGSGISRAETNSGEIPCVRYGELYTKHNDVIREYSSFISRSVALSAQKLQQGDILFAGSGETKEEIGKAAAFLDEFEAYAGGDIVILSPRNCDPVYLGYCLNSPYVSVQKASRGQGDAVVHISASALSSVAIMLPGSLEEQVAISTVVSEMDHEIHTLQQRLAKTRQIKQGMMQQLLTGKIRLVKPEGAIA